MKISCTFSKRKLKKLPMVMEDIYFTKTEVFTYQKKSKTEHNANHNTEKQKTSHIHVSVLWTSSDKC